MIRNAFLSIAAVLALGATSTPSIALTGAFVTAPSLDGGAIAALPHISIRFVEEHGAKTPVEYSGVTLASLLASVGVPVGPAVKGPAARSYVIVHAADGYATVFTLAELDSTAANCAPIFADSRAGVAMTPDLGPYRIIAPCDKTHARSAHEVTGLEIVTVPQAKKDEAPHS